MEEEPKPREPVRKRLACLLGLGLFLVVLTLSCVNFLLGEHHPVLALMSGCTGVKHQRGNWERDTTFVAVADSNAEILIQIRDAFALERMPPAQAPDHMLNWESSLGFGPPDWWAPSGDLAETYFHRSRGESILLKAEDGKIYFRHFIH